MTKPFRPYDLDQRLLLPPDLREWLPDDHLALFISDVVDELDLSAIYQAYATGEARGQPPYHPGMMVKLLLYAYCTGRPSARKIERATYEDVAFRVLAADQHPDHDSLAEFRRRHLPALAGLFVQGLRLCQAAGLVKLGHVALDGTKVEANASKHKAMSYARMGEAEQQLEREVRALLDAAERVDAAEDAQYGRGRRGDELPAELARRETRLAAIRKAKEVLEQQAQQRAASAAAAGRAKLAAREQRVGSAKGGVPKIPAPEQAQPEPGAQYNFTDPESRVMFDRASKSYVQAYNAQAAVDAKAQVILAHHLTNNAADHDALGPLLDAVTTNTEATPAEVSADSGYCSEANLVDLAGRGIRGYVATGRAKHPDGGEVQRRGPLVSAMRRRLRRAGRRSRYRLRKQVVEPVFGQIKGARGFWQFLLRGLEKVKHEWALICTAHNLTKLARAATG
jgi:transposase